MKTFAAVAILAAFPLLIAPPLPAQPAHPFDLSLRHEVERSVAAGLQYLAGTQKDNGSWSYYVGITGLATLVYHSHEEKLLKPCKDTAETDAVYARRCVPRKAHLDLIYQRHRNVCYDFLLLGRTIGRMLARFGPSKGKPGG